jgi:hypothetical protein
MMRRDRDRDEMPDPSEIARESSTPPVGDVARVRSLARLLDSAIRIPGTDIRIGLDPILGLFPGFGDLAGAAASGYIVLTSARLGAPTPVLARMLLNVGTDAIIGSVPLLGDLFDVGWRANQRNATLLERHLDNPGAARKGSVGVIAGVGVAVVLLVIGIVTLATLVVRALARLAS